MELLEMSTRKMLHKSFECTEKLERIQCELQHGRPSCNSKVLLERNVKVELMHGDKIGNVGRALGATLISE